MWLELDNSDSTEPCPHSTFSAWSIGQAGYHARRLSVCAPLLSGVMPPVLCASSSGLWEMTLAQSLENVRVRPSPLVLFLNYVMLMLSGSRCVCVRDNEIGWDCTPASDNNPKPAVLWALRRLLTWPEYDQTGDMMHRKDWNVFDS